ncbi:hypothetical protein [Billgrantia endophytica]|uniref:Outer membrane protein beta-barrel domain-containing protein n=1 Tax=Billgrantia endophytica TaxID=2033802 RepID=A0A2N7TYB0_9GAMM|nr:hypothetical protein [Halomonas endophytica]PMR73180.1 hypothetical protein C1H69_17700 [Halomonas endophytica]
MRFPLRSACFVVLSCLATGSVHAHGNVSLGIQAGTIGIGPSASWRFSDHFALSGAYGYFDYDNYDHSSGDYLYEGDVDIHTFALTLDYYPFPQRGFFISAGIMRPDYDFDLRALYRGDGVDNGGGGGLPPEVVDSVARLEGDAELSTRTVQPYLGIGWRKTSDTGFGVFGELGAVYINPRVSLTPAGDITETGHGVIDEIIESERRQAEEELRDELNRYNVLPVALIGIEYTF